MEGEERRSWESDNKEEDGDLAPGNCRQGSSLCDLASQGVHIQGTQGTWLS